MLKGSLLLLLLLTASQVALADWPSYTAETADKKNIFVMVKPNCEYCWGSDKYKQSGMYVNDGSIEPLWTVDWHGRIFLPNGGHHIIRLGKLDYTATYREEAFSFLYDGNEFKTYRTKDLISFPYLLPHTYNRDYGFIYSRLDPRLPNDGVLMKIDHGEGYPLNDGVKIDNENNTILMETLHGDRFVFDIETGDLISSTRPSRSAAIAMLCALMAGYFAYLFLTMKFSLNVGRIANSAVGFFLALLLFLIPVISVWQYKHPFIDEQHSYPEFSVLCLIQISLLPQYLLTSLNFMSQPENHAISLGYDITLQWFFLFWLPFIVCFAFLNHSVVSRLGAKINRG
ncbi:MAG: hypothetical protein ACKVQW_07630 [Pyrinomonadaceae bacterium]